MGKRFFGIGGVCIDVVNVVPFLPPEDEEVRSKSCYTVRGGNCANLAVVLSQLFLESPDQPVPLIQFLGTIGEKSRDTILDDFKKFNVHTDFSVFVENKVSPTSYIALSESSNSRTIIHYRDLIEYEAKHFKDACSNIFLTGQENNGKSYRKNRSNDEKENSSYWFHFELRQNLNDLEEMMKYLRKSILDLNVLVSLEIEKAVVNFSLMILADVVFFSKSVAQELGYNDPKTFLKYMNDTYCKDRQITLVCTWGNLGSGLLYIDEYYFAPAVKVEKVLDTIGAGDSFQAAFIFAKWNNMPFDKSLNFASEIAALKCSLFGLNGIREACGSITEKYLGK